MNCWFCNKPLKNGHSYPINPQKTYFSNYLYCETKICHEYHTTILLHEHHLPDSVSQIMFKVQFTGTYWNWDLSKEPRKFIVDYFMSGKMYITEEIDLPKSTRNPLSPPNKHFKEVVSVPFSKPLLTPTNFKIKILTYLTFS